MERSFNGVWIPKELYLHEDLSWSEKILMVEITSLANNNQCFATNEYFAQFLGLSKDRVSKMITKLHRLGLVDVLLIYKQGSKQLEKRILTPIPLGKNTDTPRQKNLYPLGEKTDRGIGENAYDNNSSFNNSINNSINNSKKNIVPLASTSKLEEEFQTLWSVFPRKDGKQAAKKAYFKARKEKTTYEDVKNGLNRFIESLKERGTEKEYIPMGSTWFAQRRWEDECSILAPKKKIKSYLDYYQSLVESEENERNRNSQIIDYDPTYLSQ